MSRDDQTQLRRLRMEMLRMRAGVERAELVSAIRDVRGGLSACAACRTSRAASVLP